MKASADPVAGAALTENLYLALMDKYESDFDEWCRETAVMELRPAGIVFYAPSVYTVLNSVCISSVFKETRTPDGHYQGIFCSDIIHSVQCMGVLDFLVCPRVCPHSSDSCHYEWGVPQ